MVATGHYHHPRVPDIPGLKEWKDAWPHRVQTSKSYRRPEGFADRTVLHVGAFISSTDIAKELGPFAKHIYQSNREGSGPLPAQMLPGNAERITGIASFGRPLKSQLHGTGAHDPLEDGECIPASVTLADGRVITDIDDVMICTGYHHTYPFLPLYHDDSADVKDANETVLVTDGTQVHSLYRDIFYMPSTQPVNTTTNSSVPLPSAGTAAIENSPTIATNNSASAPSTSTASTADAAPSPRVSDDGIELMSTNANVDSEMNLNNTADPQGSPGRPGGEAQTLARRNSQTIAELKTGKTDRRSERRARKRGVKPLITKPNHPGTFSASVNLRRTNT